jgi:hypothetical protein
MNPESRILNPAASECRWATPTRDPNHVYCGHPGFELDRGYTSVGICALCDDREPRIRPSRLELIVPAITILVIAGLTALVLWGLP